MDSEEVGNDMVRLDNSFLVDGDTYVFEEENNSDSNCGVVCKNVPLREQDRFLPIANIAKIMKRAIPENGKIAKDARECVQECISEFISFVTSEASDRCQVEKRKTINGEDVLFAMNALGFDNYVEPLKLYLKKFRETALSPVTLHKLNKTIVVYSEEDCCTTANATETESEAAQAEADYVFYA
ncbi:uncharacterized protein Nf-YB [Plodia interpunctella]|uniref:uncharacterized protein Nf-YB n=1 Tax=Plodia interpunctella TaxID=58824 RepID=UPI0023674F22|nr:uncharacterized protein LOC128670728 [Plodia interpunctella]